MSEFYVTGGTLRHDSPSYVERQADRDLCEGLLRGEFCYALTSRQMGKSSLMVRTAQRLRSHGMHVAVLDLTAVGQNLTPDQWYDGLMLRLGRQLRMEDDLEEFWEQEARYGPAQRLFTALEKLVLPTLRQRAAGPKPESAPENLGEVAAHEPPSDLLRSSLVIFVDELDVVRSLPFSTDEFFAAIRECYTRRAENSEFNRLTFCLLGVATPTDLIRDTRTTPFNIGRRVELNDFTAKEAAPLARGFKAEGSIALVEEPQAEAHDGNPKADHTLELSLAGKHSSLMLERILYWTNGHPYLTQRLCRAVSEKLRQTGLDPRSERSAVASPLPLENGQFQDRLRTNGVQLVDELCEKLFLSSRARDQDDNLLFVRERLLRSEVDRTSLLDLYLKVRCGKRVQDDRANPLADVLRLAGIVRGENGRLMVRNRIYAHVFDVAWVKQKLPEAEVLRQQEAFRRGIYRMASIAVVVLGVVTLLAIVAVKQTRLAKQHAEQSHARLLRLQIATGVRRMNGGDSLDGLPWFVEALKLEQGDSSRERMARIRIGCVLQQPPQLFQFWLHEDTVNHAAFSPDGKRVVSVANDKKSRIWDVESGVEVCPPLALGSRGTFASFSPDGQRVVTLEVNGTARIWDAATGQLKARPLPHERYVSTAYFSPDGLRLMTACDDGVARLWNADTGEELPPRMQHDSALTSARFSFDGARVLVTCKNGTAWIRDSKTGEPLTPELRHQGRIINAAFSPDSRRVVTASEDGTARVWDVLSGKPIGAPLQHASWVNSCAFSPDGRWVVTTSYDLTARVWDAATGTPVTPPLRHTHAVWRGSFSPDGRWVITAAFDQTARIWDVATGETVFSPMKHRGYISAAAFSPDGHRILTAGQDGAVRLWDLTPSLSSLPPLEHDDEVSHVVFNADGSRVATASRDRRAGVWDAKTGRLLYWLQHSGWVNTVFYSRDGRRLVTASVDQTARVWDADTGAPLTAPLRHSSNVYSALFNLDGTYVVTASQDGTAQVWEVATGRPVTTLRHSAAVRWAAFSPDGQKVATASEDKTARVWIAKTGNPLLSPFPHASRVNHVSFSPDGLRLVTAECDDTFEALSAHVWDLNSGQELTRPLKHTDGIRKALFSPDGRYIATASEDGTACIWDSANGKLATPPLQHGNQVWNVEFTADGKWILTVSRDRTVRVWDVQTGDPITPPLQNSGECLAGAMSSDARRILAGGKDGKMRLWDLQEDDRPVEDLIALAEVLAGRRLDPMAGPLPVEPAMLADLWNQLRSKYPSSFVSRPEQVLAWRRNAAEECLKAQLWNGALLHLNPLIEAEPNRWQYLVSRAKAYTGLNEWHKALADLSKILDAPALLKTDVRKLAQIYLARASAFLALKRHAEALIDLRKSSDLQSHLTPDQIETLEKLRAEAEQFLGLKPEDRSVHR